MLAQNERGLILHNEAQLDTLISYLYMYQHSIQQVFLIREIKTIGESNHIEPGDSPRLGDYFKPIMPRCLLP